MRMVPATAGMVYSGEREMRGMRPSVVTRWNAAPRESRQYGCARVSSERCIYTDGTGFHDGGAA
jgi:hypothetical protein